ncbi:Arylsulfatase A [Haladaptatus litoreus]|uniref:Arylsulfatase A n=1 Tax=Haladaptatus litoreus TaxID=553468 RepID=A0A1N7DGB0_9EURY|nr:sulfatase-like hydrolase/transferase [Haladaptatus litoreus]SIR74775.1 Arylsulfatase A [Haladaptatus litoreus]
MNVLFISIDSLRRDFLNTYRETPAVVDYDINTENLDRFAQKATVFDTHYAGSLPCMPARREWQTGIQEFLWRPWGPIEPFDTPLPQALRENGTLTQLITDHYHYFQHGSNGYYEDYNGFSFIRGHEIDAWQTAPREPDEQLSEQLSDAGTDHPDSLRFINRIQYARNVASFDSEADFFAPKVFSKVSNWLERNRDWDSWYLNVDSFDVHEPFHCPEPYASMYTDEDPQDSDIPVWPHYGRVDEGQSALTDRELDFVRSQFAGKVTMADRWFGRVLDTLDEQNLWDETMVVVTSDHGFLLGDHGWVGKNDSPLYDVLARTPLMIWHPDSPRMGDRISALTSAVDLYATVLDAFDVDIPVQTHSRNLLPLLMDETDHHRDWALYGYWGASVNVTDGTYTYHHPCNADIPTDCYSTSMMNSRSWFTPVTPKRDADVGSYLPYTESPVWRYAGKSYEQHTRPLLYNVQNDSRQQTNLAGDSIQVETEMRELLHKAMAELGAPKSQYHRLGITSD